jgi:hypothetical protein
MTRGPEELPPPAASPDDIRRAADEIMARAEFRQPPQSLYERAQEWLADRLDDLIRALFEGGRSSIFAWLAIAVIVGVIAFLVYRIVSSMARNPDAEADLSVVTERRRPATDWEREAETHAAAGRWRDALRCRYRALVARLATMGAVDEVPGRTAGEYRVELRRTRPDAAPAFGSATDLFERAWYGHRPMGADEEAAFRDLANEVVEESRR